MLRRQESIQKIREGLPSWCDSEQTLALNQLKSNFPTLYNNLDLGHNETWTAFSRSSQCDHEFPLSISKKITPFQQVLVIQTLRPDRLQSAMEAFATRALGLKELSPATLNLKRLYSTDTLPTEAILVVISPGTDPSSQELQELADSVVGSDHYHQVAMGQGQADIAIQLLQDCSIKGEWLCLKNLHLVTTWLLTLEKS